jgi:hypothetical protein
MLPGGARRSRCCRLLRHAAAWDQVIFTIL